MVKHSWKAYFRRQEETAVLAQRLCTTEEQLPRYSESENQEPDCKTTDQFLSNSEESKVNQKTESDKGNTRTEKMNFDQKTEFKKGNTKTEMRKVDQQAKIRKRAVQNQLDKSEKFWLNRKLLNRLDYETDEYLEELEKSDLVELLDIARDTALEPYQNSPGCLTVHGANLLRSFPYNAPSCHNV